MLKMLQSGEHERRAQIRGELQTWVPSQSEMRDCIFKIHSTGRNIKRREANLHGHDILVLNCKLNTRIFVSKVSIVLFVFQ